MRVGKNVLYNYLKYLHDALIVIPLRRFSYSYKKVEMSIPKIYLVDNGLYLGKRDRSKLLENLVLLELKRRGYREDEDLFYWKDYLGKEVDFVVRKGGSVKELIQVCLELSYDNESREIKPLLKASKELRCKDLSIITMNQEEIITRDTSRIKVIPLWKWLIHHPKQ